MPLFLASPQSFEANLAKQIDFISNLELADGSYNKESRLMLDNASAYVVDGSLMSFVGTLSGAHQKDVLNSTLLAQLAATKKFDRNSNPIEWYNFYRTVLENVGWVVQGFSWDRYNASGSKFDVDKAIIDIMSAIATGNEAVIVKKTIDAMKALDQGDGRLRLFESSSHSYSSGNFQIGLATDEGGVVAVRIGAFHFTTSSKVTRVLWFGSSKSSTSFNKNAQTISLNEDVYDRVRQAVIDKLGDKAESFVLQLDI